MKTNRKKYSNKAMKTNRKKNSNKTMKNHREINSNQTGNNSSRRLLIGAVIDTSPSTVYPGDFGKKTANELINKHIRLFISQLLANPKIRACAEICFVTYSSDVQVSEFMPITDLENNMPEFKVVESGGTRTISAIDAAYKAIDKRASQIKNIALDGTGLYTSAVFLLTDGDASMHDTEDYRKRVTAMVNERTIMKDRTEKVLPFIVGLGSHIHDETKKMLADLSKGFLDGAFLHVPGNNEDADRDYSQLFHFISESLVRSMPYCAERDDFDNGFNNTATMDELLAELRELVYDVYPNMVCTVTY